MGVLALKSQPSTDVSKSWDWKELIGVSFEQSFCILRWLTSYDVTQFSSGRVLS